jgi:hypothetical protein
MLSVSVGTILRQNVVPGESFQHLSSAPPSPFGPARPPAQYERSSDIVADQGR